MGLHDGHHGICNASKGKTIAGSAEGCDMVNVAVAFKAYDKVRLLGRPNRAAMEGCINIECCSLCVG